MTTSPQSSESAELLPCPFCGERASMESYLGNYNEPEDFTVYCGNCDFAHGADKDIHEAAKKWNTRAPSTQPEPAAFDEETIRPDFEKWLCVPAGGRIERSGDGYKLSSFKAYWVAYKAAARQSAAQIQALTAELKLTTQLLGDVTAAVDEADIENEALTEENARLREAVELASDTFRQYGDMHAAKPDWTKAKRNYDLQEAMLRALAPHDVTFKHGDAL